MKSRVPGSRFRGPLLAAAVVVSLATVGVMAQQAPDRSKLPEPGAPPALKLPPIQKRTLANGLPVWIVEMHEVPVVNLTMVVKAGASADPNGKYGLASFTAAMLDEGAGGKSALELADAVEFLGAGLSTGSSFDSSSVRLQAPVSRLDEALPLMADVLLRPAFSQAEVDRLRKERLTSLVQTRDNPSALATAAYARLVFGPRHRYGTPAMGNQASNTEMTPADLREFYTSYYQPQNAHLIVVGDVTAATLLPKLEQAIWTEAENETSNGIACNTGATGCVGGRAGRMVIVRATAADNAKRQEIFVRNVLPAYLKRCGPRCAQVWNQTVGASSGVTLP